jgi:hypothetical protein
MGRPKKDPSTVRSVPLTFRVSPMLKEAIDALLQIHAAETGDDSLTGWFHAMVHREARRTGVSVTPRLKPVKKAAPRENKGVARALGPRPRVVSVRPRATRARSAHTSQ